MAKVIVPVGVTMPDVAGSVTVAVQVVVVLTGTEAGRQETLVVVEWVAPLLKVVLNRATGKMAEFLPSVSINSVPEAGLGQPAGWIWSMSVEPLPMTMYSTLR